MTILEINTKEEFVRIIKESSQPVLVDFCATWCGPCRNIAPFFDSLAEKYHDHILFVRVDVDENEETADMVGVTALPTFVLYEDSEKTGEVTGADPKALEAMVTKKFEPSS